jgi:hypothetical protein
MVAAPVYVRRVPGTSGNHGLSTWVDLLNFARSIVSVRFSTGGGTGVGAAVGSGVGAAVGAGVAVAATACGVLVAVGVLVPQPATIKTAPMAASAREPRIISTPKSSWPPPWPPR